MNIETARITGGFWHRRMENAARRVLWEQLAILKGKTDGLRPDQYSPVVEDFRIAAGLSHARYAGRVYSDSELGKWIEAAAYSLAHFPDPALEREVDGLIDLICRAQMADGYINTYFQVLRPESRLKHYAFSCELYNMGHLMEAAAAYCRTKGKRAFLDAMCRAADLLCGLIGPGEGRQHVYDGHAEIELGLLRLYDETGRRRYLELADYFVRERGKQPCFFLTETLLGANDAGANDKWFGPDHHQAHKPVREQREADGHAVKVTYLYSTVTELIARGMDGDGALAVANAAVWRNMVNRRMYVTGAVGSQGYAERFTVNDDLPSDRSYAETCASAGVCFWGSRLQTLHRSAAVADVVERALYNGLLAGWSLEGDRYFYVNVLHSKPGVTDYREDEKHVAMERSPWFECACCPSNLLRVVCNVEKYLFGASGDTLYIDGYAESEIAFSHDRGAYKLTLHTTYPYDGRVRMELSGAAPGTFRLALRKPLWCQGFSLRLNGAVTEAETAEGYLMLHRCWIPGDCVELHLWMPARLIAANPGMWDVDGRAALARGPIIYCVEGVDNGGTLAGLRYRPKARYTARPGTDALKGEIVLTGVGARRRPAEEPYAAYHPAEETCTLQAVPYFAWGNRGRGEMDVWLPVG